MYLLYLFIFVTSVLAWNELCREAIESTAMSAITHMRLRRLKVLLKGGDLVDYTWWGEEVMKRIPESQPLHYQLQTDDKCASFETKCKNDHCIIPAIKFFFAVLMNSGYSIVRDKKKQVKIEIPKFKYPREIQFSPSDCIKYLVILISDLHHPLHLDFIGAGAIANLPVDLSDLPVLESKSKEVLGVKRPSFVEFIRKVYMPEYIKINEMSWYGSWTHVSILGSRYNSEMEMFNRKMMDTFEVWGAETSALNCEGLILKEDLVPLKNSKYTHAIKFTQNFDERLGFLLRFQIVLAGARIAIVINYILSHRDIAYHDKTGIIIDKHPQDAITWNDIFIAFLLFIFLAIVLGLFLTLFWVSRMLYREVIARKPYEDMVPVSEYSRTKYRPITEIPT